MKPNIKVERTSLRNSLEFIAKWKTTFTFQQKFCSTAPVRKFTKSPYKSLKLDYLHVFNKLFRVDDKGLALQSNSIKRQSVSGHISNYTRNNTQK